MQRRTPRKRHQPGRNDTCWCGSGLKYKYCHLNRQAEAPLPVKALLHASATAWKYRICQHPEAAAGVCDQIVSAHSLQRSKTLDRIVDATKHIGSFYPLTLDSGGGPKLHRTGWRNASTFTGFCGKHDNTTFAPLEQFDFEGTAEQCFFLAYRAVCHELFQKSGALRSDSATRHLADRGRSIEGQRQVQRAYDIVEKGTTAGLADYKRFKGIMDAELLRQDYSAWSRVVISFTGDLCVASTSAITPNLDIDGNMLQVLHDLHTPMQMLPLGILAAARGGAFVFTWRRDEPAPRRYVESILEKGENGLPGLLVQLMFAHVENTYFSPDWWESLSEAEKKHLADLATVASPYYESFPLLPLKLVPWQITGIVKEI